MVAERRKRLRQFDHRFAHVGALAAQVVGGCVDERAQGADAAGLGRLQCLDELLQLVAQIVPLDWHRGVFLRNHRVSAMTGPLV